MPCTIVTIRLKNPICGPNEVQNYILNVLQARFTHKKYIWSFHEEFGRFCNRKCAYTLTKSFHKKIAKTIFTFFLWPIGNCSNGSEMSPYLSKIVSKLRHFLQKVVWEVLGQKKKLSSKQSKNKSFFLERGRELFARKII